MSYRLQSEQIKPSNNGTLIEEQIKPSEKRAPADEQIKLSKNGALTGFAFWLNSYNEALLNWVRSSDRMLKKATELSDDIISFSRTRLQTDLDSWQAVVSCRNTNDLLECQRQFAQKASSQCLDQAGKLASRMTTLIADAALSPLREQTSKSAG